MLSRIVIELAINAVASAVTYILADDIVKALMVFLALLLWDVILSKRERAL